MPIGRTLHLFRRANANKGRIARSLANTGKGSFWAMADQGIASLGNFGIMFLLAKEYASRGTIGQVANFGIVFELMWVLNSIHGALIVYPMTVRGATNDRAGLASIAGSSLILTLCGMPLIGGAIFVMGSVTSSVTVGAWAALAAVIWQLQETTRRGLMAELRFRDAVWGDLVRYIGHVACVWVLARWHILSLEGVFQLMAAAAALGMGIQAWQLRVRIPAWGAIRAFAIDAWKLGRWVVAGNASNVCTTTLYTVNFYYWWGPEVVGIAFALNNLLRLTNPLMFTVTSLVTPHAARARAQEGLAASKRVLLKYGGLGALMLAPYLGVLILFPHWSIRLATNPEYQKFWWVLVISAVSQGLIYLATVMSSYLNAVERNRLAFYGQVTYSAMFVVVGMPLTAIYGLAGAAVAGVVSAACIVAVNLFFIVRLPSREDQAPPPRGFEVIHPSASPTAA